MMPRRRIRALAGCSLFASLLACGGDRVTSPMGVAVGSSLGPPLGDPSLVIAFTMCERKDQGRCWLTLATEQGAVRTITSAPPGFDVVWSPDRSTLVYLAPDGLWGVSAAGTDAHLIPNTSFSFPNARLRAPSWSPDGKRLAAWDVSSFRYVVINADGSGLQTLTGTASAAGQPVHWSADATALQYTTGKTIWEVDVATNETRQLVAPAVPEVWHVTYSPDGSRIAFVDQEDGMQYVLGPSGTYTQFGPLPATSGVWVMNRDGTGLRQLLNEYVTGVTWSPDGRKLLYKREAPSGPTGLFMVDVGGSAAPQPFIMDTDSLRVVGADWAR